MKVEWVTTPTTHILEVDGKQAAHLRVGTHIVDGVAVAYIEVHDYGPPVRLNTINIEEAKIETVKMIAKRLAAIVDALLTSLKVPR